jgi:hypothetical protein
MLIIKSRIKKIYFFLSTLQPWIPVSLAPMSLEVPSSAFSDSPEVTPATWAIGCLILWTTENWSDRQSLQAVSSCGKHNVPLFCFSVVGTGGEDVCASTVS